MRTRSESDVCSSWCSQCCSSTYGLPRILQNNVALSIALYGRGPSLPNRVLRLISDTIFLPELADDPLARAGRYGSVRSVEFASGSTTTLAWRPRGRPDP